MYDRSVEANLERAIKLSAKFPALVAMIGGYRKSKPFLDPSKTLSLAADFLYMLSEMGPDRESAKPKALCSCSTQNMEAMYKHSIPLLL